MTASPAQATSGASWSSSVIGKILAAEQGSTRVGSNQVRLADGTRITFGQPGTATAFSQYDCLYGALCLFPSANFGGTYVGFDTGSANTCRDFDLSRWSINNWASSIVNNRPSGTVSTFWDTTGESGLIGYQHAYGYRQNLALDTAAIGGTWDNRIGSMRVC